MRKKIGSFLIFCSFALAFFIYYPFLLSFFPQDDPAFDKSFYINIPKIKASAPIIRGVDPWDKADYEKKLNLGVALAKGFASPGEEGTIFLFTHSALPPWEMTRTNTAFLHLGELKNDDLIFIHSEDADYTYKVFDKKEVWPNEVSAIKVAGNNLILQTCSPIGTDLRRILIFAKPILSS